jgi:hypothetical protein
MAPSRIEHNERSEITGLFMNKEKKRKEKGEASHFKLYTEYNYQNECDFLECDVHTYQLHDEKRKCS